MTKVMLILALLVAGVLTMGMSQGAAAEALGEPAGEEATQSPVQRYLQAMQSLRGEAVEEAVAVLQPLAEEGWAIAQNALAKLYHEGRGVARDRVKAYVWYRRAAEQSFPPAQAGLAVLRQELTAVERRQLQQLEAAPIRI